MICEDIPAIDKEPWLYELKRKGIQISDMNTINEPIGLFIGADVAGRIIIGKTWQLSCEAVVFEILLGWTLLGKTMAKGKFDLRGWKCTGEEGKSPVVGLIWNKRENTITLAPSSL